MQVSFHIAFDELSDARAVTRVDRDGYDSGMETDFENYIDFENQKISLSIRALLEEGKQEEAKAAVVEETPATEEVYSEEMKVTLGDLTGAVSDAVPEPEEEKSEPVVVEEEPEESKVEEAEETATTEE